MALIAADAVDDVDQEVADFEVREVGRPAHQGLACTAGCLALASGGSASVAEDLVLGDDGDSLLG